MNSPLSTLHHTPTTEAMSTLLRQRSAEIDSECERFLTRGDAEALHDLRVALRRLHSLFVAFAPLIAPTSRLPNALRQLQKRSNTARDLEVSLTILRGDKLKLPWLEQLWLGQLEQEYRKLRHSLPPAWQALRVELEQPEQLLEHPLPQAPLGPLTAELLQRGRRQFRRHQRKLCRHWRDKAAHRLRIEGKQLRYLLEPFADELPPCHTAVKRLKRYQDRLGDYHDLVVLRAKLKRLLADSEPARRRQLKQARKKLQKQRRSLRRKIDKLNDKGKGKKLYQALRRAERVLANG